MIESVIGEIRSGIETDDDARIDDVDVDSEAGYCNATPFRVHQSPTMAAKACLITALCVAAVHAVPDQDRVSALPGVPRFVPLPVGDVVPEGWLLIQLKLQADGLSGHLAMFWNDVQNSIWLNGPKDNGDAGLHERAPYWLNGFVPLAYQLKAAGIDVLCNYTSHPPAPT